LRPRAAYAEKLARLGIPAGAEDVITSGYVLGYHLARHYPALAYYVIGEQALLDELRGHGLRILGEFADQDPMEVIQPEGVEAVVVAFDRTLDYRKLNTAYQALVLGARFFATNADKTCPMPGGGIPDAGATIAALEHLTGRKLELLAGKPSRLIMEVALNRLDLPPERCVMVGDRLETDMLMGQQAGMKTAAVLSGASTRQDVDRMQRPPDFVLENIGAIPQALSDLL
jgi:HAD superfamily hydrolase (TIGR01450 family)